MSGISKALIGQISCDLGRMPFGIALKASLPPLTGCQTVEPPIRIRDLNQGGESADGGRCALAGTEFGCWRTCYLHFNLVLAYDEFVGNVTAVECRPATLVPNFVSVDGGFVGAVH